MAKNHGAKQQKKLAKQKAKRKEKRATLSQRDSTDPTIRLQRAEKWPIVKALVGENLWEEGLGYLVLARQEGEGRLVFATYLVDVFCLGVKDAFWQAGSKATFDELVDRMDSRQKLVPIEPSCLVKFINGAVDYAMTLGFRPHPDFRHAALLLQGIDPATCAEEFSYGKDGKPFYIQGPHETPRQAQLIMQRVRDAGGHFLARIEALGDDYEILDDGDEYDDDYDEDEDDTSSDIIIEPVPRPENLPPSDPNGH
jgi:hypothetical protein